ncbi:F-box protein skip22-like [Trifolium pratense]|uniref:F-box protein skip22-like n=1 Tax=Trifolium pratense TaxID=57577 RepID=A0A2K3PQD3_TRIPR|nr:F-box protein skip22-like [Trifolium pratense]
MKLRLRSLESKETLKIEVPDPCSINQLKSTISQTIPSPSSSSSLHLSLNRKDEINASSLNDNESLNSLGIASGDLIFYTFNPNVFSIETLPHKPTPQQQTNNPPIIQNSPEITMTDAHSTPVIEKFPTLETPEPQITEMIDGSDEAALAMKNSQEPDFVKRVIREALGDDVNDFKLLVFAVHAVILESGFVRVDQVSGMAISCSHLVDGMSSSSMISLRYTLPEILTNANGLSHSVNLKIQTLGNFVNVYGSLSDDVGSRVHRVYLDKCRFARPLELMLSNSESNDSVSVNDDGDEVFELWKIVKDRLVLPLLIDLCDKAGLDLPPCFMRLPMELKLLIFEYLPGDDLAKVCCTCSELQYLASNDELWKKKFEEEFGQGTNGMKFFKNLFAFYRATKKKAEEPRPFRVPRTGIMRYFQRRRGANRFGMPPIWGGEYDLQPNFGVNFPGYTRRRAFIPPCNLGGF